MAREFIVWELVFFIAASGCSSKQPTATAPAPNGVTADTPSLAAAKQSPDIRRSSATSSALDSAAKDVSSQRWRELMSRYLQPSGQGGWRPNEQAATELEKLSPEETAQLWSLLNDPTVEVRRG